MKKITVFLLLIAASTQLKAQQLLQTQPDLKLNDGLQNAFKLKAYILPQVLLTQPKTNLLDNTVTVYSYMPVSKTSSNDKMPIAPLGKDGVTYAMLIKKIKVINPAEQLLSQPIP